MKFNVKVPVIDRNKDTVTEPVFVNGVRDTTKQPRTVTLGMLAIRAIDLQLPEDKDLKPDEVRKRFFLTTRLEAAADSKDGTVDLTPEEVVLIQNRCVHFGLAVAGQLIVALDGK